MASTCWGKDMKLISQTLSLVVLSIKVPFKESLLTRWVYLQKMLTFKTKSYLNGGILKSQKLAKLAFKKHF